MAPGGEPAGRAGIALRGTLIALAATALAFAILSALTWNVLERQQWWCDDCPDLPDAVYASDDRYVMVVVLAGAGAIAVTLGALALALVRRSRHVLRVGAIVAAVPLALAAGATALHWLRF